MATKAYGRNGSGNGRLAGKVAIVTGGGTGIGEAIAHKFAKEGARVIVSGLPDDPVEDVAKAIRAKGGQAIGHGADVAEESGARAVVDLAIKKFKRLDVLVNNASVFLDNAMTEDYPIDDFDQTIRLNIRSAFLMTRFALPNLRKTRGAPGPARHAGRSGECLCIPCVGRSELCNRSALLCRWRHHGREGSGGR